MTEARRQGCAEPEEYATRLRRLEDHVRECDDRARTHALRMQEITELVAAGWQGSQARAVLSALEDVRTSVLARHAGMRRDLDDRQEDLRRARRDDGGW